MIFWSTSLSVDEGIELKHPTVSFGEQIIPYISTIFCNF